MLPSPTNNTAGYPEDLPSLQALVRQHQCGGFIGSVAGGIAGYWGGSKAATTIYDAATAPRRH
jgi:hypothetical protein